MELQVRTSSVDAATERHNVKWAPQLDEAALSSHVQPSTQLTRVL